MRIVSSFLIAMAAPFLGYCQKDTLSANTSHPLLPSGVVKISPLHLGNFYPSIEVSYEYAISTHITLQSELGYIFNPGDDPEFIDRRGIKAKQEVRYYFPASLREKFGLYSAAELYGNWVNFERDDERTECFDLECQTTFRRKYHYTVKYREQGFSFKGGIHFFYKRLTLDLNLGLSVRFINYSQPFIPPEPGVIEDAAFFLEVPNEEDRTAVGPTGGFRVGYQIKRRRSTL